MSVLWNPVNLAKKISDTLGSTQKFASNVKRIQAN